MESQQESRGCGNGDEEKMERFLELIRDMREARSRMMRLRETEEDGELATRQSKRRRADGCCGEGKGRSWVPKFEAEDFGMNAESGAAAACRSPRALRMVGVREKLEEDGSGLNLKLTL